MPEPVEVTSARLQEIELGDGTKESEPTGKDIEVQFNPETLKLTYSNTAKGGEAPAGAAIQFVGSSNTKLSLDLWFDASARDDVDDVRTLTADVVHFVTPQPREGGLAPPGVRFLWGSFLFEGVVESLNETLEFFSAAGRPLRAQLSLSLTSQDIQFRIRALEDAAARDTPGTTPRTQPREDESVQQAMARQGDPRGWQGVAEEAGLESARRPPPGSFLDLNA